MVKSCIWTVLLVCVAPLHSQSISSDIQTMVWALPVTASVDIKGEGGYSSMDESVGRSELKMVSFLLIRVYQQYISSQDMSVCNFSPSCSRYCAEAFQRHGLFLGSLLTSDRLQRCNGLPGQQQYYRMSDDRRHLIDSLDTRP